MLATKIKARGVPLVSEFFVLAILRVLVCCSFVLGSAY